MKMVFESIVADVLNRLLSKYVENVNQSQLKISIWSGDIVLENLFLKEGALDKLDLPIKTTYGQLAKLVLNIPWKNLYTAPVLVSVEQLFLLAVPNRDIKYDQVKEEQWLNAIKNYELQRFEEVKRKRKEIDEPKEDDTFTEKLVSQIIKNIQIKINSIHIRYEDRVTDVEKPFSFGITLAHFYLYTTDMNWMETVIQDNVTKVNKIMDIESLAIYWNSNCKHFKDVCFKEKKAMLAVFEETICTNDHQPNGFHYVLEPMNAKMRIFMNTKPELDSFKIPKYDIDIFLNTLGLGINKLQYRDMLRLAESMNRMALSARYRKYRPQLCLYRGNYKIWWRFAYVCVLEDEVRRVRVNWNWNHISQHRKRCRAYADAYRVKLMATKVSKELDRKIKLLENDLDAFNILLIRERVEIEVEKGGLMHSVAVNSAGWFPWIRSFVIGSPDDSFDAANVMESLGNAMTPREKEKLFTAIGYTKQSGPVNYPSSFIDLRIKFNLDTFQIEISDKAIVTHRVMHLTFSKVSLDLEQRPVGNGIKASAKIFRLSLYGLKQGSVVPLLITPKNLAKEENLLDVLFEMNPLNHACDQRLLVFMKSLQIVHDSKTTQKVVDVFKAPFGTSTLQKLQAQLESVKDMSATGLQYAIEQHAVLELKVDVRAPYIIVPHSGFFAHNKDILVVNLGRVTISSFPRNPSNKTVRTLYAKGTSEETIKQTLISQSYDKFFLNIENIQILIVISGEDWFGALDRNKVTPLHLLEPSCFIVIFNNCLIRDDPSLPKAKLTAIIRKVAINLTNVRLFHLFMILSSIPHLNFDKENIPVETIVPDTPPHITGLNLMQAYWDAKAERKMKEEFFKEKQQFAGHYVQPILMDLTFELEQLTVEGFLVDDALLTFETLSKCISLQLIKIEVEIVQRTFDMDLTARLGGISLDGYDVKRKVRLVDTPMTAELGGEEYLFTLAYSQIDKQSPDLHGQYNNTVQLVKVHFSLLTLVLHQEVLVSFVEEINKFKSKLKAQVESVTEVVADKIGPSKKDLFRYAQNRVVQHIRERKMSLLLKKKRTQGSGEESKIKIKVDIQQIKISITTRTTLIVDLIFAECFVQVTFSQTFTKLVIRLKNIQVFDCHPESIHSQIISVVGDETLWVEIVKYKVCQLLLSKIKAENPDMALKANISCIRIIYLNRFVSSLLAFYYNVQVVNTLFEVTTSDVTASSYQSCRENKSDGDFVQLSINLDAPIIIVPLNSRSMEAVMLHLGYLTITNKCHMLSLVNGNGVAAAIDLIKIKVENVKGNRVMLRNNYEVLNEIEILHSFTFEVEIDRNLSLSWHKNVSDFEIIVHVPEVSFTISEEDCKIAIHILNQNFAEHDDVEINAVDIEDTNSPDTLPSTKHAGSFDSMSFSSDEDVPNTVTEPRRIVQKIYFTLDGITINMFSGGAKSLDNVSDQYSKVGLVRFSIQLIHLRSVTFSNGGQRISCCVRNCYLDDVRPGLTNKYRRLMKAKDYLLNARRECIQGTCFNADNINYSLMYIKYVKKCDMDTFMDLRIQSFELIVCLEFITEVKEFYMRQSKVMGGVLMKRPQDNSRKVKFTNISGINVSEVSNNHKINDIDREKPMANMIMVVNIIIEDPDIVFVDSFDSVDSNALCVHSDIVSRVQLFSNKTVLNAYLNDLQLYVCCFDPPKRRNTKSMIVRPCTVNIICFAPHGEMNIDIFFTDIRVSFTPGTIDLLSKIYNAMFAYPIDPSVNNSTETDYYDLWNPKPYSYGQFWFMQSERHLRHLSKQSSSINLSKEPVEICTISAPLMIMSVEAGHGQQRQPLVLLELKLECLVYDWSSDLRINSNLAVEMAYYNTHLAIWEPLLEPVEREVDGIPSHHVWELKAVIQLNHQRMPPSITKHFSTAEDEYVSQIASVSIDISSSDNLELTLTKTGIEVLTNLSAALFEPCVASASYGAAASYVVINTLGVPVTVILHEGSFKLLANDNIFGQHEVVLESGCQLGLCLDVDEETLLNNKSGPITSDTNVMNQLYNQRRFLYIRVGINTRCCRLALPIFRTDRRYFSLKHNGEGGMVWGMISDVNMCNGGTILTLRSILSVHNHTKQPIEVYCRGHSGDDLVSSGAIQPNVPMLLPLQCIYTASHELFFCVIGFKPTSEPFVWSHLQRVHMVSEFLNCPPLDTEMGMPFFINVVGTSKPVIYENSHHYTPNSVSYSIHVHPAITLKNLLPVDILVFLQGGHFEDKTIVKAGDTMQLVHAEPIKSTILAAIPCYRRIKWVSKGHIQLATSTSGLLQFISEETSDEEPLQLLIHRKKISGRTCIDLFSQFWFINKTGLTLSYRQSDDHKNTCNHDSNITVPIMFSFWGVSKAKKMISIMIENGEWSDKFSLDAAGSSGIINCKVDGTVYQIAVEIQLTQSKLTKKVVFSPFFVLVNNHQKCIECQEIGHADSPWIKIAPDDCIPFWPHSYNNCKELRLRFENDTDTSTPFPFIVVHSTLLKLENNGGVFVDVHKIDTAVFITFLPYKPGLAPTLLINHTDKPLHYYEDNGEEIQILNNGETVLYTWNKPSGSRTISFKLWKKEVFTDDLQTDGTEELLSESGETFYWASFLDGFQRVTVFTTVRIVAQMAKVSHKMEPVDMEITVTLPSIGISLTNNKTMKEILYICAAHSNVIWESRSSDKRTFKPLTEKESHLLEEAFNQFNFERTLGLQPQKLFNIGQNFEVNLETKEVIQPSNIHLRRSYEEGVWFQMRTSRHQSTIRGKLNRLQMDNQLCHSVFPVLFAPVSLPRTLRANHIKKKPFLEWCVVQRYHESSPVKHYRYFKILFQEFHLKVDMNFLAELFEFLDWVELTEHEEKIVFDKELDLAKESLKVNVFTASSREEKNYYEYFHFSPVKMHISFSLSTKGHISDTQTPNFIMVVLRGLGVTLTDVHDVVLRISCFERKNTFSTYNQIYSEVYSHYTNEFLKNAYVLVFGLDLIGNPWGFLMGLGKGVQDLFYEPYLGAVQGHGEFGRGILVGVGSLFGSAVGGMCGAVSRISGALGTGVAVLTFDSDFQQQRKATMNKTSPNMRARLVQSSKALVMGMVDGISGVVMKPVLGAYQDGVTGFCKGVGKGVAGLVTRPTVGVFDFVSSALNVVPTSRAVTQFRPPRHLNADGPVTPYVRSQAEGHSLLHRVEKGRFAATDTYMYHVTDVNGKKDILLLTDKRIMYIKVNTLFMEYFLDWECTWERLQSPYVNSEGVFATSRHTRNRCLGWCGKPIKETLISIKSPHQRKILLTKIRQLTESYNNKCTSNLTPLSIIVTKHT